MGGLDRIKNKICEEPVTEIEQGPGIYRGRIDLDTGEFKLWGCTNLLKGVERDTGVCLLSGIKCRFKIERDSERA
jgi:hypothetical protein